MHTDAIYWLKIEVFRIGGGCTQALAQREIDRGRIAAEQTIKMDDQCRASMRNVWAIGDLTGEPMPAHRAMAQIEPDWATDWDWAAQPEPDYDVDQRISW